jgi:transposase
MPKAFPPEFRQDVIAVARNGESSMAQIARDCGISESCLARWLIADRQDGLTAADGSSPDTVEDPGPRGSPPSRPFQEVR